MFDSSESFHSASRSSSHMLRKQPVSRQCYSSSGLPPQGSEKMFALLSSAYVIRHALSTFISPTTHGLNYVPRPTRTLEKQHFFRGSLYAL